MTVNQWEQIANRISQPLTGAGTMGQSGRDPLTAELERLTAITSQSKAAEVVRKVLPAGTSSFGQLSGSQAVLPSLVQAIIPGAATASRGGAGFLSTIANGLSLAPLVSGLVRLFGGGGEEAPPPLVQFSLPASVNREESVGGAGVPPQQIGYGQNGLPRAIPGMPAPPQQVTVQVQAIDSQSFLDHSEDIARAVREAMLYSHSLNDVVTEL